MTEKNNREGYHIRELKDSEEDASFVARMISVASGQGFTYKLPRLSIQQLIKFISRDLRNQPKEFYERSFILQSGKENAGYIELKFHDSSQQSTSWKDTVKYVGIRGTFWCIVGAWLFDYKVKPGTCCVYALAVDENHRKKGYGRALLQKGDEVARSRKCSKIQLYMVPGNKVAQSLYEKHGYVVVKENITKFGLFKLTYGYPFLVLYEKQLYQTSAHHR